MSAPTSPHTSPRRGKYMIVKVILLDDSIQSFQVPHKALGWTLFDGVLQKLQVLEADYFDLEFCDHHGNPCWLDHEKPIIKQVASPHDLTFRFLVKFYTPDPGLLEEEYTRYLFALQIRRDVATGCMPCLDHTGVLIAAYVVQAELGDFIEEEYHDASYLSGLRILPNQDERLELKIMEQHRKLIGQSPAEADFNLLDTARKVELYGIRMHPAKDHEGVFLHLAVAHMGVLVFQNTTKINTFSWAKIRKLSFKRKKFLIKLHPEGYMTRIAADHSAEQGYYKDTVEFYFESRNECKNFWKKCLEHHAFFRCHSVKRLPRNKTRVVSRGSSFRYSGRTQKQLVEYVRDNYFKRPPFERAVDDYCESPYLAKPARERTPGSTSLRTVSSATRSVGATPNTGTLNSRDINFGHNTSTSSGSHTIDMGPGGSPKDDRRVETAEVHDDSSQSGSRSLNSPKKDRYARSGSEDLNNDYEEEDGEHHDHVGGETKDLADEQSPRAHRIDPSQFMLSKADRKFSEPVFNAKGQQGLVDDQYLSRSPEVENIPERVEENRGDKQFQKEVPANLRRTQSATTPETRHHYQDGMSDMAATAIAEEPPPPPPPIYQEEWVPRARRGPPLREVKEREMREDITVTTSTRSTTSAASATLTSSCSVTSSRGGTDDSEEDVRKKRYPADKAYYIAKELLMTERTYKKDLEVLTVWFRNAVSKDDVLSEQLKQLLFANLDPIYDFHCSFLKEIEQRLAMWEGKSNAHLNGDYQKIGDIMLNNMKALQLYRNYIERHEEILSELELAARRSKRFEQVYKEFEAQKVCYLPLNTFLLKPAQRLLHYKLILERLLNHYTLDHPDYKDSKVSLSKIMEVTVSFDDKMKYLENMQKLIELQRDLVGIDNLVQASRDFIREGCLQKLSRKGYQQRMFFLFSDMLVYTSRTATPSLQFKVHGQLPLRGMIVDETDAKMAVANSFTIYGGNRCLLVAASSEEERDKWLEDLRASITAAKEKGDEQNVKYSSLKSNTSSSDNLEDTHDDTPKTPPTPEKQIQHRANTTMHVCWHRNTSVSMRDHNVAIENQLSGYLLRKFKNSNGWQKLWVVFTNFCLFFYKTFQDDFPLASLPLLGYSVTTPSETDGIHKDYVFKLQFKNHVYFFRAESQYTFERWIEVIGSATSRAQRMRLFSRMDSQSGEVEGAP